MVRALTSIDVAASVDASSLEPGVGTNCALEVREATPADRPAAAIWRKRRRDRLRPGSAFPREFTPGSGVQPAARCGCGRRGPMSLAEQFGELFGDGATKLLGIHDRDRAAVVARDIVADTDGDQFDRRTRFDFLDDVAQMPLEVIAGIDRQ